VPAAAWVRVPVPEIAPAIVVIAVVLTTKAELSTTELLPAIEPVAPPLPICSVQR